MQGACIALALAQELVATVLTVAMPPTVVTTKTCTLRMCKPAFAHLNAEQSTRHVACMRDEATDATELPVQLCHLAILSLSLSR